MRWMDEPPADKPYRLVGLVERAERSRPIGHESFGTERGLVSGWLDLAIKTVTPVHVASGLFTYAKTSQGSRLVAGSILVRRYQDGSSERQVVIPGSSLKGAVRAVFEAITDSCMLITGASLRLHVPVELQRCSNAKGLCPACRLFGAQNYAGRVYFEDVLLPIKGMLKIVSTPLLWQPARGGRLGRRYLSDGRPTGRKFYRHLKTSTGPDDKTAIGAGLNFAARIAFQSLAREELGALFASLGLAHNHEFPIKLGGGKPVGLGTIRISAKEAHLTHSGAGDVGKGLAGGRLGAGLNRLAGESLTAFIGQCVAEALQPNRSHGQGPLLVQDKLAAVAGVYSESNLANPAPAGPY